MHKLDDDTLMTSDLLRAFIGYAEQDGGNGQHFAMLQLSDGRFLEHNPGSPELEMMQKQFARDVIDRANKEIAHDGAWLICFTHPGIMAHLLQSASEYARFHMIFLDKDGDIQFFVEWSAGQVEDQTEFSDVLLDGWESWLNTCEMAHQQWQMLNRQIMDAQPAQTYKKAKGEKAPTAH